MNLRVLLLVLAATANVQAQRLPENFNPEKAARDGQALTAELLSMVPTGNYTNNGTLRIGKRRPVEIPIRFTVLVAGNRWISLYEALGAGTNANIDTLTILNEPGKPSRYFRGTPEEAQHAEPLTAVEVASLQFAGSDFGVGDLGLEFLRWPVQRLLKKELRRSQACNVLESIHPNAPGGYTRVVSWLDIDTGGIVYAEAFDTNRKRVKEFIPKRFKKVDGEWHLQEMRIEDLKSHSRTAIRFDVGGE